MLKREHTMIFDGAFPGNDSIQIYFRAFFSKIINREFFFFNKE